MKIGTVLKNEYARKDSPSRYMIYTGTDGRYINTVYAYSGKIEKGKYSKQIVGYGKEIHPIGQSDVLEKMVCLLEDELTEYAKAGEINE